MISNSARHDAAPLPRMASRVSGYRKHALMACLLVTTLSAGNGSWGAEPEPAAPGNNTSETSKPATDDKTDPAEDVFIPTEDISEDFAVSFPVDI